MFMIVNTSVPKVFVFEPSSDEKRKNVASIYGRKKIATKTLDQIKEELKEIRLKNRETIETNTERFRNTLEKYPHLKIHFAPDAKSLSEIIKRVTGIPKFVSLNKSNVVINEIRPYLKKLGINSYIRYFSEFEDLSLEKKFLVDYWMLPGLHAKNLLETFDLKETIDFSKNGRSRTYVSILGVNAASAETGNLYFLQHMSNISKDIKEANTIFFIVPLEKIVKDDYSAKVHVRSMGIFGLESVILDLKPKKEEEFDFEGLPFTDKEKEIHIVIFDNLRKSLLSSHYTDLLLCIDCRACARQCPVGQHLPDMKDKVYSPKNLLLLHLQGAIKPFELCLHCGRCEVECPVGIQIPELLWKAQVEYYQRKGRSILKKMLDNPELLAKIGVYFAPFSNWVMKFPLVRAIMKVFPGIHNRAKLPSFSQQTFREWYEKRKHG
ncbi:MAG: 4Fe-4S dicluster domain-containing protein [Deltaproteobacteria bacterium]|nr:4Fe-4S dicluster domain-containing protein [Deltaproteobacteria bacterium]